MIQTSCDYIDSYARKRIFSESPVQDTLYSPIIVAIYMSRTVQL